jgi:hypothetical protein
MATARPIPQQQKQMHIPAVFGAMLGLGAYLYANSDENAQAIPTNGRDTQVGNKENKVRY